MKKNSLANVGGFFLLANSLFFFFQLAYVFLKNHTFIIGLSLPWRLYLEGLYTLGVHAALYLLLTGTQLLFFWGVLQLPFSLSIQRKGAADYLAWIIWLFTILLILSSNAYFFPLSIFSHSMVVLTPIRLSQLVFVFSILITALLLNSTFFLIKFYPKISLGSLVIMGFLMSFLFLNPLKPRLSSESQHPNIFIIGIDSLNPKYINPQDTPTVYRFIQQGVLFSETISPLAHTYPAWNSILTGLYPFHHQAIYNLMPPDNLKNHSNLASFLQKKGYYTLFATDDRRFNNITTDLGFDRIIGPRTGANDFLLGTFNDFPLSNLIINTPLSQWLFPYNYGNRGSHFAYYPETFNRQLIQAFKKISPIPLFLAVHFTLPHWPYAWAESNPTLANNEFDYSHKTLLYKQALRRTDQQVAELLFFLQKNNYLSNSMVILLSDHGETLYKKGSRLTNLKHYQETGKSIFAHYITTQTSTTLEKSAGHGTDLLSPNQYHCLLAFRLYQERKLLISPKKIDARVALIDITPTVLDFLKAKSAWATDGISLLGSLQGPQVLPVRHFILESGMLPNQFLTRQKAKELGIKFFSVDPLSGQLLLKKEEINTLNRLKLYGILYQNWVLAFYPVRDQYIPVLLNLTNNAWTDHLHSSFAKTSPASELLAKMEEFYNKKWLIKND